MADTAHDRLVAYVQEMHAFQEDVLSWVETSIQTTRDRELAGALREHHGRTKELVAALAEQLEALGSKPSTVKRAAFRMAALAKELPYRLRSEKTAKNARDAYITAAMATAGYALMEQLALRENDEATAAVARRGREAQEPLSRHVEASWDRVLDASLAEEGIAAP